ncbi:GNAT family N-acetyltransferase [Singulisphaera sp. PoT]|uniref:GNAT family N-acetyltransferase n=1 Tax=Singulisphaera sp. PoT TaxID=3411797 RepID=UPI003BF5F5A4
MSPPPTGPLLIRDARPGDCETIVSFNSRLAEETEGKRLDIDILTRGVTVALNEPNRLRYWVAEIGEGGPVVGQAAISLEWSDWRNGWLWWFQSVYVHADYRSQGVFRALYRHIREIALASDDVIGLRLYVEVENQRAQSTYAALGMRPGGYHVYEELWLERSKASSEDSSRA